MPTGGWSSGRRDRVTSVDGLRAVLERSRRLGFLGPGSLRVHEQHSAGFAAGLDEPPARLLDLGSGGGVPGLVLAQRWPSAQVVLLDAAERRCEFLREAVAELGWRTRVSVVRARAEEAGRDPGLRGTFDVVTARGFGPPAVTAECGAPFLRVGGLLVVSAPPEDGGDDRWPARPLAELGLVPERTWREPFHYRSLRQAIPCPDRYPRRTGRPAKQPLF